MAPTQIHIAIRVSSDPRYGYGHLARQLALNLHLGATISWFTDPEGAQNLVDSVAVQDDIIEEADTSSCKKMLHWANINPKNILICDNYHIAPSTFAACSNQVFYFCDYEQASVSEHITLVNAQPTAAKSAKHLAGPTYFAIETKGRPQQPLKFANLSQPINCLISFGSVDSGNHTGRTLAAILNEPRLLELLRPVCLLGPHFLYGESVQKQLRSFPSSEILEGYDSLLNIPVSCPIAVGAPGLSHAERLYMGAATVLVSQNANHIELCESWEVLGCGLNASRNSRQISRHLMSLIDNKLLLARSLSLKGQSIINGNGAAEIARQILRRTGNG